MEGVTGYVFRNAYAKYYGGIERYFTPFVANKKLGHREKNDVCPEHNAGMAVVPQILTNRAEDFLAIAEILREYGYDTVNLNLGCPSGTVAARGRGAGFLARPDELEGTTVYHDTPWATAVTIRYYSKEAQETYSDYLPITVKDGHYRLDLRWKY
jgi:tRNA-dihydrouridine synthase